MTPNWLLKISMVWKLPYSSNTLFGGGDKARGTGNTFVPDSLKYGFPAVLEIKPKKEKQRKLHWIIVHISLLDSYLQKVHSWATLDNNGMSITGSWKIIPTLYVRCHGFLHQHRKTCCNDVGDKSDWHTKRNIRGYFSHSVNGLNACICPKEKWKAKYPFS